MSQPLVTAIVGLGNPGPEYAETRHNVGFWFIDALARQSGSFFRTENKFKSEACRISLSGHSVWLLKPMTFMNRSGEAIASFANFYKLSRPGILVVHDELDLPPGTPRLKRNGGPGGHNGLRDSIRQLGGNDFLRLRIGIGHPGDSRLVSSYVLRRPPQEERELLEDAIAASLKVLPKIVDGQLEPAMNTLHRFKPAASN